MTNKPQQDLMPVSHKARMAAKRAATAYSKAHRPKGTLHEHVGHEIAEGHQDDTPFVQAFARFEAELASRPIPGPQAVERVALKGELEKIESYCHGLEQACEQLRFNGVQDAFETLFAALASIPGQSDAVELATDYSSAEIEFIQCLFDRYSENGGTIPLADNHSAFMGIVRRYAAALRPSEPVEQTKRECCGEYIAGSRCPACPDRGPTHDN